MIGIVQENETRDLQKLVQMALIRSTSRNQVAFVEQSNIYDSRFGIFVLIEPSESLFNKVTALENVKVIVFGKLPRWFLNKYQSNSLHKEPKAGWDRSPVAETFCFAESPGYIEYTPLANKLFDFDLKRPLERFDFTDEWNNLGYGRVRNDHTIWSISDLVTISPDQSLSYVKVEGYALATYSGVFDESNLSICWYNRAVGPIDSPEWHLIEKYISSYRFEELPCVPVLLEIPQSYDAAITMRLDCDEDIESCRHLWSAYNEMEVPFSIAIHTTNLKDARHHSIVREMYLAGVSIMSHTATHAPNWGGSYESALFEAEESANAILPLTFERVKYAVSPFHQAPSYALKALSDKGYKGCVGGIIKNDPEFLFHTGGNVIDLPRTFIGHSQQVMLHGDCILEGDDPLIIYKESFDLSKSTQSLFGYLDHPFSERYTYGWESEEQRELAHRELIEYIRRTTKRVIFLSENDALDFIFDKSFIDIMVSPDSVKISYEDGYVPEQKHLPKVLFKNEILEELVIS